MPDLKLRDLSVFYGRSVAVKQVSIDVSQGKIVAVLGPNGAGKSTCLNAILGLLPYTGSVRFGQSALDDQPTESRIEAGLCLVPETRELFAAMSVEDNLALGAYTQRASGRDALRARRDEVYALFPRLKERRRQLAGTLSGGERQMLALGRALMAKPRLLMLDEPSLGLAPLIVHDIFKTIAGLKDTGMSLLVVEQNARIALDVADYAYVLENGKVTLEGTSKELAKDSRLVDTYLGAANRAVHVEDQAQ